MNQPDPGDATSAVNGVGPHAQPWPDDPRLDPELLAQGDRRNVLDRYRYWSVEAIVADLDHSRSPLHVAIENWQHDINIGSIVRTANAFNVAGVHIVGKRDWNRRGAMVTDRYLHVFHHPDVEALRAWCDTEGLPLLGIDNELGSGADHRRLIPPGRMPDVVGTAEDRGHQRRGRFIARLRIEGL